MHTEDPRTCAAQLREAFSWDGPVAGHPEPQPHRLQMVKDMLDESGFAASPGHVIPGKLGER